MKKYWKLIALPLFIIVVFAVFYINERAVTKNFPQFNFYLTAEEAKAVESLVIHGDLFRGMFDYEPFRIEKDGTTYLRDESFMKRLYMSYRPLEIERLQKEYRNFMRGKDESLDLYFENEEILAYSSIPYHWRTYESNMFDIAVLDKKTNKTNSFSLPIPNHSAYWYVDVYGVTVQDQKMSIVTVNDGMDETGEASNMEVHLYTVDIEGKKLLSDELIAAFSSQPIDYGYEGVDIIFDDRSTKNEMLILHSRTTHEPKGDDFSETVQMKEIIKYNIGTLEVEEVSYPKEEQLGKLVAFAEDQLYFANIANSNLYLTKYDSGKGEITKELEAPLQNSYSSIGDLYNALVEDGIFYFIPPSVDGLELGSIVIVDLKSLTLNYNGQITIENPPKNSEHSNLYFNSLELRKE